MCTYEIILVLYIIPLSIALAIGIPLVIYFQNWWCLGVPIFLAFISKDLMYLWRDLVERVDNARSRYRGERF